MSQFERITKQILTNTKIGDVVYLKAKVVKQDPLCVSFYGANSTSMIAPIDLANGIVYVTSYLFDGKLNLISPKDNKWEEGQEALVAHVIVAKSGKSIIARLGNDLNNCIGGFINLLDRYEGIIFVK